MKKKITLMIFCFTLLNSCAYISSYISEFRDNRAWNKTIAIDDISAYNNYIEAFPKGKYVTKAKLRIDNLFWEEAQNINTIQSYSDYIKRFPNGIYTDKANENIEELYWKKAQIKNTISSYKEYILLYPNGKYVQYAKSKIDDIMIDNMSQKVRRW